MSVCAKTNNGAASTPVEECIKLWLSHRWQFLWADTFEELRASLFESFYICFPLAFGVLVFATENVLVSLYSIVGIAFIVASVHG